MRAIPASAARLLGGVRWAYPSALTITWMLITATNSGIALVDIVRPALVAIATVGGVQAMALVSTKSAELAAYVAVGAVALLAEPVLLLPWAAFLLYWLARRGRYAGAPLRPGPRSLRIVSAMALSVTLVVAALSGVFASDELRLPGSGPLANETALLPDIYLILLDGYPRRDTLAGEFGIDQSAFLESLRRRGFDVYEDSRANYSQTTLTLASMLHMRHVDEIARLRPVPGGGPQQKRMLRRALLDTPVEEILTGQGYTFVTIPPSNIGVRSADVYLSGPQLTSVEIFLLQYSGVAELVQAAFPEWIADQHRQRIEGTFTSLEEAATAQGAQFVFAHAMAPHPPFVFRADGSPRPLPECFPGCDFFQIHRERMGLSEAEFAAALAGQVAYTNRLVLRSVDRILRSAEGGPEPVIVLFSDHGGRHDAEAGPEWVRNFYAARTPGHPRLFGDGPTPINTFPRLLHGYLGLDLPIAEDRQYVVLNGAQPLEITPVQDAAGP